MFIKVKEFYVEKFKKNEDFTSISTEIDHPYILPLCMANDFSKKNEDLFAFYIMLIAWWSQDNISHENDLFLLEYSSRHWNDYWGYPLLT